MQSKIYGPYATSSHLANLMFEHKYTIGWNHFLRNIPFSIYRTRAIITHGLYINPLFESQKHFLKEDFSDFSRAGYDAPHTVGMF